MFFKRKSYFDKIQERTKKGIKNSTKDMMWEVQQHIHDACDRGYNTTKVRFEYMKIDKVKHIAQILDGQGFKTTIDERTYGIDLNVQW